MNYYIDFDNTLYETAKLTEKMLSEVAHTISNEKNLPYNEVLEKIKPQFNSTLDNIFSFAEKMAKSYDIDSKLCVNKVNEVIDNGEQFVFPDAKKFLKRIRKKGNKLILLTYVQDVNKEYQKQKINGSGIKDFFDDIIITSRYKFNISINYKNGIFIDDDPRDLLGLYEKKPIKVIRIRKKSNKRSKLELNNDDIEEFESFDDIEEFSKEKNEDKDIDFI